MEFGRRTLLTGLGGLVLAGGMTAIVGDSLAAGQTQPGGRFDQAGGDHGWKPHKLDPKECAEVAYLGYWHHDYGCGYGAFYAIVGLMAEKYGAPYNQFPFTMLEANKGGISDWGTICGALYGGVSTFSLFWGRKEVRPMANDLFRWYETTKLPVFDPGEKALGFKGSLPQSEADSVLCHISVSRWCYANKIEADSKQRSERCGRLTADVAAKTAEILNAKIDAGKDYKGGWPVQKSVSYCGECHQTKGNEANWAKGVMDCTPCHSGTNGTMNKFKDHP